MNGRVGRVGHAHVIVDPPEPVPSAISSKKVAAPSTRFFSGMRSTSTNPRRRSNAIACALSCITRNENDAGPNISAPQSISVWQGQAHHTRAGAGDAAHDVVELHVAAPVQAVGEPDVPDRPADGVDDQE